MSIQEQIEAMVDRLVKESIAKAVTQLAAARTDALVVPPGSVLMVTIREPMPTQTFDHIASIIQDLFGRDGISSIVINVDAALSVVTKEKADTIASLLGETAGQA